MLVPDLWFTPRSAHLWLALLLTAVAGCGGNDAPPPTPDAGMNHCANDVDRGLIDYGWLDAGQPDPQANNVGQIVEDCALLNCLVEIINWTDVEGCMDPCIDSSPAADLSAPCRQCYYAVVNCASVMCVIECSMGSSPACDQCVIDKCDPDLYVCSGLTNP